MDKTNIIVKISLDQRNIGQVLFASDSIRDWYGIDPKVLKGMNVCNLMPGFLANRHDGYLRAHIE